MDYMFPSRNHENLNSSHDQEPPLAPLFLQFPSPFLDDIDTTTILPNLQHHQHHQLSMITKPMKPTTKNPLGLSSKGKCVRKRRSVGKKDRHSKIHTAQGLRDRRMRLSVHTARKFFDLNDLLGFDKASKTIEWLFNKSKKAIEEVAESFQSDDAVTQAAIIGGENNIESESPLSACEKESVTEITAATNKGENLVDMSSRKSTESYSSVSWESKGKAIKHVEKPNKPLFGGDPNLDFSRAQLGFSENLDNHNMEDQSSCFPLEYSNTYHFLKQLHLDNSTTTHVTKTNTYLGNITAAMSSTNCSMFDYNKNIAEPPAGWLNSRNTFLGFLGGWDSESSRMESGNGIVANINGENPNSGIISSHFANFHSQNQGQ